LDETKFPLVPLEAVKIKENIRFVKGRGAVTRVSDRTAIKLT